jgi:ABC-type glycerol-3-phosphate transport system substrate-binding protein
MLIHHANPFNFSGRLLGATNGTNDANGTNDTNDTNGTNGGASTFTDIVVTNTLSNASDPSSRSFLVSASGSVSCAGVTSSGKAAFQAGTEVQGGELDAAGSNGLMASIHLRVYKNKSDLTTDVFRVGPSSTFLSKDEVHMRADVRVDGNTTTLGDLSVSQQTKL